MTHPFAIISILAALCALVALAVTALRLRRARKEFARDVSAWKLKLDLDLRNARNERDQLLDALRDAFMLVDADARVLDHAGLPIPGLHAAGELVGGLFYHNYPGGSGLTAGSVFGRRAGRSAGRFARRTQR